MEFVIITGMSGAGKTGALHVLEDIGYYCVDNLPPALLPHLVSTLVGEGLRSLAVAVDARSAESLATLPADVLTDYERLLKQFRGLAVETIQGNIPTACHTALQASSMSDLNHDGRSITHCPYCHRLLVLPSKEA